jgi:hypothetical protein
MVLALMPFEPPWASLAAVVAPYALWLGALARPLRLRRRWRLDGHGLSTSDGRQWRLDVPAGQLGALCLRLSASGRTASDSVEAVDDAGRVLHREPLALVGDPVTVALAAAGLNLPVRATYASSGAPGAPPVDPPGDYGRVQSLLLTALFEPPPVATVTGTEEVVHPEPAARRLAEAVAVRVVFAAAGGVLLVSLLAPAVHDTWSHRLFCALGAAVGVVCAWQLRRPALLRPSLSWRVDRDAVVVEETGVPPRRIDGSLVAAFVPLPSTVQPRRGNRGIVTVPGVLAVDHALRPLAELPLRGLDRYAVARVLLRHGYRWVDPEVPNAATDGNKRSAVELPPPLAALPGGRIVVDRDGVRWVDELRGSHPVLAAGDVGAIEIRTVDGRPWGLFFSTGGLRVLGAPLALLRANRSELARAARAAGYRLADPDGAAYERAMIAQAETGLGAVEATLPDPTVAATATDRSGPPPITDGPPTALRDSWRTQVAVSALLAGVALAFAAMLTWRVAAVGGSISPTLVSVVGVLCALLVFVVCLGERNELLVGSERIALRDRRGRQRWVVHRADVAGVAFEDAHSGQRLMFLSLQGILIRAEVVPGTQDAVRDAVHRHGWPLGRPGAGSQPVPPPEI